MPQVVPYLQAAWQYVASAFAGGGGAAGAGGAGAAAGSGISAVGAAAAGNTVLGAIGSYALQAAIAYGINAALQPRAERQQGGELSLAIDPDFPRQLIIGQRPVGGSLVAHYSNGGNNSHIHLVYALADHRCAGLMQVYADGSMVWPTPLVHGVRTTISTYSYSGGPRVWMTFYDGRPGQTADAWLIGASAGDELVVAGQKPPWTSSHVGAGVAYIYVELQWDSDILTGIPRFLFNVKGASLYDRRKDDTAGGEGDHRWDDPTTWEWTDNPAVAVDHYLLGIVGESGDIEFGVGLLPEEVPYAEFAAAADLADEDVETGVGDAIEVIKRYRADGVIGADQYFEEIIEALQVQQGARIVDVGGQLAMLPAEERTVVVDLTDQDLVRGEPVNYKDKLPFDELIGAVEGRFADPANLWQPSDFQRQVSENAALPDGGEAQVRTLELGFETHPRRAARLASIYLEREGLQPRLSGHFMQKAWKLRGGDWFTFTSEYYQLEAAKFEVIEIAHLDDFTVMITARAASADFVAFDNDNDPDLSVPPDFDPEAPGLLLDAPEFDIEASTLTAGQVVEPCLEVTLTSDESVAREIIIEYGKWDEDEEEILGPTLVDSFHASQVVTKLRKGVMPTTAYIARAKAKAGLRESPWTEWSAPVTTGASYVVATATEVPWTGVTDPDGYRAEGKNELDYVRPEWSGAEGDGVADDTVALQWAINTGKNVLLSRDRRYRHTETLIVTSHFQKIYGEGVLVTDGAVDSLLITDGATGVSLDLKIDSPDQTAGYILRVSNGHRVTFRFNIVNAFGFVDISKCNVATCEWAWGYLRGPGVRWWGDDDNRSDILAFDFCLLRVGEGYAFDWDGNCNSLVVKYLGFVCGGGPGDRWAEGMIIRNTGAGPDPAIARIGHIEIDYPVGHGVEIETGLDYDFVMPYIQGGGGDGLHVHSGINNGQVRIAGGKLTGFEGYGINNAGGLLYVDGGTNLDSNVLGRKNGPVGEYSSQQYIGDDSFYLVLQDDTNPLIALDANDYFAYDRAADGLSLYIDGVQSWIGKEGATFTPRGEFGDAGFYLQIQADAPIMAWDGNDYLTYDRTGNVLGVYIGGVERFAVSASGATVGGSPIWSAATDGAGSGMDADLLDGQQGSYYAPIADPLFTGEVKIGDGGYYLTLDGSNPVVAFDGNDYLAYDRTANAFAIYIGGAARFAVTASGLTAGAATVWTSANDGAASGLDADLLDGLNATAFGRYGSAGTWTAAQTFQNATYSYTQIEDPAATSGQTGFVITTRNGGGTSGDVYLFSGSGSDLQQQNSAGVSGPLWWSGNDGAGGGLDADLLDGFQAAAFGRYAAAGVWTAGQTFGDGSAPAYLTINGNDSGTGGGGGLVLRHAGVPHFLFGTASAIYGGGFTDVLTIYSATSVDFNGTGGYNFQAAASFTYAGGSIWHAGNDGAGGGLDADLLDGLHASSFVQTAGSQSMAGPLTVTGLIETGGALRSKRSAFPYIELTGTGYGTDLKSWQIYSDNTAVYVIAINDALNSVLATPLTIHRNGHIQVAGLAAVGDANYFMQVISGSPVLAWDTNDYLGYDRSGNAMGVYIGASLRAAVVISGLYNNNANQLIGSLATLTNGAGAQTATFTNSPVAGNPTKWIAIDDNGTTRYIPAF